MKRLLALLLALTLCFALVACGNERDTSSEPDASTTTQTGTESTNNTETNESNTETSTNSATSSESNNSTTSNKDNTTNDKPSNTTSKPTENTNPEHTHSYSSATCTTPAKCSCGATKGSALGHNFNAATCTTPKTCKTCGKTEGTAANHSYNNNGTCTKCGTVLPEATEYITFNDVFLENYIKQSLGIQGTNKVSKYAMSKLTSFDIKEGVTDVQDLKYATNLQSISIDADNVKNLNVLCNLSKITHVSFGFDKRVDVSFMKNMKYIESIYFNATNLTGGSAADLVSSSKLKELFFYNPTGGAGYGIDFLSAATSLESLELWHAFGSNSDITVLKTLPKLKRLEILTYNSTSDAQRAVYAELMSKGVSVNFM